MSRHEDQRADLPLYLTDDLSIERRAEIESALQQDPKLRETLAELRHAMSAVADADAARTVPELEHFFDERIAPTLGNGRRWPWRLGLAAAAVLLFTLGVGARTLLNGEPETSSARTMSAYMRHGDVEHNLLRGLLALSDR